MGDRSADQNGQSPQERREQAIREDRELKREVDEALREWDRLERDRGESAAAPTQRARA